MVLPVLYRYCFQNTMQLFFFLPLEVTQNERGVPVPTRGCERAERLKLGKKNPVEIAECEEYIFI